MLLGFHFAAATPPEEAEAAYAKGDYNATVTHAIEAIGPDVLADTQQSGGGEDFSWYLEEVPGAMARLGVWSGRGPQLDLHQPTFDLDERALGVGVRLLVNLVDKSATA